MEVAATMPSWRKKPANRQQLNKRLTPHDYQLRLDAARAATQRLYCDVLELARACARKPCRRARRCLGEPDACLRRGWPDVAEDLQDWVRAEAIAGGRLRIAPATHQEWVVRQWPPSSLM